MRFLPLAALFVVLALVLAMPLAAAQQVNVTVTVLDRAGSPVAGAVVAAYQNGTKVDECTTDTSGTCTLTLANTTTTFFVTLSATTYAVKTVADYLPANITIDLRTLNMAYIATNTTYNVPFDLTVVLTNTTISALRTNATVWAAESLNFTFPLEVKVGLNKVLKFVYVTVDGARYNTTTVSVDMAKNYTVIAHYTAVIVLALNVVLLIAVLIAVGVVIAILILSRRMRLRRVKARTPAFA